MSTTLASGDRAVSDRLLGRAQEIGQVEMSRLLARTPRSAQLFDRATRTLPFGVVSSFQKMQPYPIYVTHGRGSHIWDQDGTEYLDFHCGFGAMVVGHAHPRIVEAVHEAASRGTHFAVTTESAVAFAETICRRFNLETLRFTNSGTEATMDAIRVARAATGRDVVCKIEGSYHGHHDSVMFSIVPNADLMGGRDRPGSAPVSKGMVKDAAKYIQVVPFNDADHLERVFQEKGDQIACLIMEPAMMNIGIVVPQPGYLKRVRELCTKYGVVFIYDEIKTGFTIAAGGATERFGVQPDLVCLAKAISGGGLRWARRSDAADRAGRVADGNLQRQPAGRSRRAGDAERGPDRRRVPPPRAARHPTGPRMPGGHRSAWNPGPHGGPRRQRL